MQKLSKDVAIDEQVKFETLLGNQLLVAGLKESGYERPSPIQLKAIPLGRLGTDLIAQAKSGTGKTVVFGVLALDTLQLDLPWPQVVIVAPTREIAVQIRDVIRALGRFMKGLRCEAFIGGIQDDPKKCQGCHVVVASPGRLLALMRTQKMVINHVRLWVLDEADKLIEARMEPQIAAIYSYLPKTIQCVAFSATFSEHLLEALNVFMNTPERICLTEGVPTLEEVQQYHVMIPAQNSEIEMYRAKFEKAAQLLGKVPFYQCMIFVNHLPRAVELTDWLNEIGWKSGHICASLNQHQRLAVMDRMRQFKVRILVCSDLIARGIDIDRVNLVINLDLPWEIETYLHRVGRTGRYGTSGVAINLIGPEDQRFLDELKEKGIQVGPLPGK
ncbi:P-loop containing nucleoside triphosphate hydrolase protein [Sporodiniella umbellata]|nr:P-loop containing nucleoside triphosphate hydrolase protein [Sporodiniella umbellata]